LTSVDRLLLKSEFEIWANKNQNYDSYI
jgi:hypothetical protein